MSTAINWPSTLPQSFQQSSYSESPQSGLIRTNMDSGPPKVRRRFTALVTTYKGSMILTNTQVATFKSFFTSTIKYGSLSFNFPDPTNLLSTIEVLLKANDPPYNLVPDGETLDWMISFELESVP